MASAKKKVIPIKDGTQALHQFLDQYQARLYRDSSTEKGHVYWSDSVSMWLLVMRKGNNAVVTFHPADDCPCAKL